jgi:ribose transport system ATP-binding protein
MTDTNKTLLHAKGICKSFNGVQVLKNVELEIKYGEVHALMGENGAGKSTIIKIITGIYAKDAGQIFIDGQEVEILSRQDARDNGISVIYQELSLVPELSVTDNVYLGQEIARFGVPNNKAMRQSVQRLIDIYKFDLDPDAIVSTLSMAQRQMVEILKALSKEAKLIIMDEPTASLTGAETETLFETIDFLRSKGASVLYISHRLEEIYRIADRLTVMRDGENVGCLDHGDITPEKVTTMMIGHEIKKQHRDVASAINRDHRLEVKNLCYGELLKDVSFTAYGGEILGIGGLVGSGRTELIKCVYGALRRKSGTVELNGKSVSSSIKKNILSGFGFVPEDRRVEGFFPVLSIEQNLSIASYDHLSKACIISRRQEHAFAEDAIKNYDIRPTKRGVPVGNLSGGNQQKVILGRWLSREPSVLLLDEPTVGVDVGVKAELYSLMRELADKGAIIIMVSSDLEELTNVSDRILIMHHGRFFEEFYHDDASQQAVLLASSGTYAEGGKLL